MKIGDVMGRAFVSVRCDAPLSEVAQAVLNAKGAAAVLDPSGALVGIVAGTDLIPADAGVQGPGRAMRLLRDLLATPDDRWLEWSAGRRASDVMKAAPAAVREDEDPTEVGRRMLESDLRYVPVMRDDRVVGILTRPELLRLLRSHDLTLRKNVERMLWRCHFTPPECSIDVEIDGGTVLLEGDVGSASDARVVASLIAGLDGVTTVTNLLTVRTGHRLHA
ncbi:MAG: CBS domain-containing protein [Actinomycetota bacterium]